jgi:hypothetical protein
VLLDLAMIGYAMATNRSDAVTVGLLTLGLVSVVAGVVLPRIEGEFSASGQGVAGKLLSVTQLDTQFVVKGPALAADSKKSVTDQDRPIMFGDVWDELDAHGFHIIDAASGNYTVVDNQGHQIQLPGRGHSEGKAASPQLLSLLRSWGLNPTASGKYPLDQYG